MSVRTLHVLVADHDSGTRQLLDRLVSAFGGTCVFVEDGKNCAHRLRHERFDVLFLEVFLPLVGGLEILDQLREEGSSVSVIAMSELDDAEVIGDILQRGARAFLMKPLREADVSSVLSRIGAGTMSQNLTPGGG